MNIGAVNNQASFLNHEIRPLPKHISLGHEDKSEIEPLPKHISLGNEEKVYDNGMTLREIRTQTMILDILRGENVNKLEYGYQAHINQEALKDLNFLEAQPTETELSFNDFLSSNLCSLEMPTTGDGIVLDTAMISTNISSPAVMPIDMPTPVSKNLLIM